MDISLPILMKLSIIVPTLNEEKYLPLLLESIRRQKFVEEYEIIIADKDSKDNTREIAERYGCKIVEGGLPSVARNNGARLAKGEILLFLDADVILPDKNFLRRTIEVFYKKNLGMATCYQKPIKGVFFDKVIALVGNFVVFLLQKRNPHAAGFCIFAKKEIHDKINGYNEQLINSEDHDYVRRGSKHGKFRTLKSSKINVSVRRYEKEGRLRLIKKYIYFFLYRMFKGEITEEIQEYEFGQHI